MKIKFTYLAECGRIGIEMAGIDGRQWREEEDERLQEMLENNFARQIFPYDPLLLQLM
jgi:hypothetical protein